MAAYLKVNLSITNRPSVTCPVITCSSGSTQTHTWHMLANVFTIHGSLCHCSITYVLLCIRSNLVQGLVSQTESVDTCTPPAGIQPRYTSPSVRWVRTHDYHHHGPCRAADLILFYFFFILMELTRQYHYALPEHIVTSLITNTSSSSLTVRRTESTTSTEQFKWILNIRTPPQHTLQCIQ